jgi:hypothetical protein
VSSVLLAELQKLVSAHGYWVVALIVVLPGVVANDRAECGDRNHHPNVEAGFCRGINGNEYEDRFCQCAHRIAAGGRNRISARANSSYV